MGSTELETDKCCAGRGRLLSWEKYCEPWERGQQLAEREEVCGWQSVCLSGVSGRTSEWDERSMDKDSGSRIEEDRGGIQAV